MTEQHRMPEQRDAHLAPDVTAAGQPTRHDRPREGLFCAHRSRLAAGLSILALTVILGFCAAPVTGVAVAQDATPTAETEDGAVVDDDGLGDDDGDATGPDSGRDGPVFKIGNVAVTGFSGTIFPAEGVAAGVDPVDETLLDPKGVTLRVFQLATPADAPKGQEITTPKPFEVAAEKVGQVFGLAFDDGQRDDTTERVPNLYVTASVFHGLQIVAPDSDDDGRPERLKKGKPGADFMDGQFGTALGGGPGSIYKIDGMTGEITLFANVTLDGEDNSGPGLGNIAFDPIARQLLVSDLDTGMIHRFDLNGTDVGTFDHGTKARPAKSLEPVAHDPSKRMEITSPRFDVADTKTWGLTDPRRRVLGLAVKGGRLYYGVHQDGQVWSVSLQADGSFGDDARWELDADVPEGAMITDLAFDQSGLMYVAARGAIENSYDYASFAKAGETDLKRYRLEAPDDPETPSRWVAVPDSYAVGYPAGHAMAVGGVDLGFGYDASGTMLTSRCDGTVFKTGEDLRNDPDNKDELIEFGGLFINGLQITDRRLVRPENEPPKTSYFLDFDGLSDEPDLRGHVGDVEVYRPCLSGGLPTFGAGDPIPPLLPPGGGPDTDPDPRPIPTPRDACLKVEPQFACGPGGTVVVDLTVRNTKIDGADSLQAKSLTPGVSLVPGSLTMPAGMPFSLTFSGALPGERTLLDLCSFKSSDAESGAAFPCCKAQIEVTLPPIACAP